MTLSGLRHTTTAGVLYNRVMAVISPLLHSICHYVKRGNTLHSMYEWISYRLAKLHYTRMQCIYMDSALLALTLNCDFTIYYHDGAMIPLNRMPSVKITTPGHRLMVSYIIRGCGDGKCKLQFVRHGGKKKAKKNARSVYH